MILYAAENATQVALDAIQILGKCYLCNCSNSSCTRFDEYLLRVILLSARESHIQLQGKISPLSSVLEAPVGA